MLAVAPGNLLDFDATVSTFNTPQSIDEHHRNLPQGDELKATGRQTIVARATLSAAGADRPAIDAGLGLDFRGQPFAAFVPKDLSIDKRHVGNDTIEDSLRCILRLLELDETW
jgi:hypothetical protein